MRFIITAALMVAIVAQEAAARDYKLLCVGDSLTVGFHVGPMNAFLYDPYATPLKELLRKEYPGDRFEVVTRGVVGECVTRACISGSIPSMLAEELSKASASGRKFDFVIVLGGTNDLSWKIDARPVLAGLTSMLASIRRHGAFALAVSIPETSQDYAPANYYLRPQREIINAGLRDLCVAVDAEPAARDAATCLFVDFGQGLPHTTLTIDEKIALWSDEYHPTKAGYTRMARIMFAHLATRIAK